MTMEKCVMTTDKCVNTTEKCVIAKGKGVMTTANANSEWEEAVVGAKGTK